MKLFKKAAVVQVETIDAAIAPFRTVRDNLMQVIAKSTVRRNEAANRIAAAEDYYAEVMRMETEASAAAGMDIVRATKIADALGALLGDLSTVETPETVSA